MVAQDIVKMFHSGTATHDLLLEVAIVEMLFKAVKHQVVCFQQLPILLLLLFYFKLFPVIHCSHL